MLRSLTILSLLIISLSYQTVQSQSVSGTVSTKGNLLSGIHFAIDQSKLYSISDNRGKFLIENMNPGNYELVVTGIGYITQRIPVVVTTQHETTVEIIMVSQTYTMPGVDIIAGKNHLFTNVPGSLNYLSPLEIQAVQPVNGNEILRKATGLNVVEEEGLGLRTNIGIRGLDPDRSRTVLMLEDGVPVALAPYGEPEMYYTPAIERMSGIEILKGSGSILYGPQTIGGVINYQTIDPPASPEGFAKLTGGPGGYFTGLIGYGSTFGKTGVQVNYLRKQADDFGTMNLKLNDLSSKLIFHLNEKSILGVKVGLYNETSNSTYIGLTQSMYDEGGNDFTELAPDDKLAIRRYSMSLNHNYRFSKKVQLQTLAYGYTTTRDWQRQEFASNSFDDNGILNPKPADYSGVTWGDETIEGGALYMRNATGNRNRTFEVAGIEPRINFTFNTGKIQHELTSGVRYLYERAFEQRINGSKADASSGSLVEDEIRTGNGYSIFLHDKIVVTKKISITGGIRFEHFDYERDIRRGRFSINGVNVTRDTMVVNGSEVSAIIPGAGINLMVNSNLNIFGGVHRGFAPPRVKDAISSEGVAYELDAELSWNYEAGIRSTPFKWLSVELTGFYMDFENQVIPVSESSGGTGSGLINGGQTTHTGVEAGFSFTTKELFASKYYAEIKAGASYVKSVFSSDRFIDGEATGENINGNFTPYAPEWNFNGGAGIYSPFGLSLNFNVNYVSDQFSDEINSTISSANGRTGIIPSHYTVDAGIKYVLSRINTTFSVCMKNVTDERSITTRRPQGIRVGLPRMVFVGVKVNF